MAVCKLDGGFQLYHDEQLTQELMTIKSVRMGGVGTRYFWTSIVTSAEGRKLGAVCEKNQGAIRIEFLLQPWYDSIVTDDEDNEIGTLRFGGRKDNWGMAMIRRVVPLIPQKFTLADTGAGVIAEFRWHFNPFVDEITLDVDPNAKVSKHLVLAVGILLMSRGRGKLRRVEK